MKKQCFVLTLSLLLPFITQGATVVISATAPTQNIIKGSQISDPQTGGNGLAITKASSGPIFGGNTFSLDAPSSISALTLHLGVVGATAPDNQGTISLVSFTNFNSSNISYNVEHTENVTMPDSSTLVAGNFITFNFDSPASLEAGSNYGFVFEWINNTSSGLRFSQPGVFDSSVSAFRINQSVDPTTYIIDSNEYFYFLQGAVIPEPATIGLVLGIFCLALVAWCRRQKA